MPATFAPGALVRDTGVVADLDALEALAGAATPGPWKWVGGECCCAPDGREVGGEVYSPAASRKVADLSDRPPRDRKGRKRKGLTDADARFIAAAREAVPALVAEVRALRAALTAHGGA